MLQDVIDLRNSKWVPRRQDLNPKTIDQIQKEANEEQLNIQVSLQQHVLPDLTDVPIFCRSRLLSMIK